MFHRIVAAAALALAFASGAALAEPSPNAPLPSAAAATQQDDVQASFIAWTQRVMGALERANRACAPFLQATGDLSADNPDEAMAMLRELNQQAAHARAELAASRAELAAIGPFAHPRATPGMLQMGAVVLRDSRNGVDDLDRLLGNIMEFAAAIERGDEDEMNRIAPLIDNGAVLLVRNQATTLRARQQLLPAITSGYHAVGGMASMYDGMAALMPADADFDVAALESAAASLDASLLAERAAITLERVSLNASDPHYSVMAQLVENHARFADANERSRNVLRAAAQEGRAGTSNEDNRLEHIRVLAQLEYEYQTIARQQIEIYGRLSQ